MTTVLNVENLGVRFRSVGPLRALITRTHDPFIDAVCGVSFSIEEGETLGIVGESGSGKSTIARSLLGIVPAHTGTATFSGQELLGLDRKSFDRIRRDITMMFQDPVGSLSPRLNVRSLILEPFRVHKCLPDSPNDKARELLEMVGLSADFLGRFPHQLSGGQARRVGIARALALDPKLLIADEPTAGLDVSVQGEVLNLLARLQAELGLSILIITHNLNVVRHITDKMAIMYLGHFVETGPTEDVFFHPRHPYTEALLSANPTPDPEAQSARITISGEVPSLMNRPSGCEFHTRCPYAQAACAQTPPDISYSDAPNKRNNHMYTCHFPLAR
jgi:peptide/nickel transport system ATP-binding protein